MPMTYRYLSQLEEVTEGEARWLDEVIDRFNALEIEAETTMYKYELQLKATHAAVAARNPTVSLPTLPPFRTIYTIAQMDEIVQYQRTITKLNLKSYNNVGPQPQVQATKAMHQEQSTSSPIQGSIVPTETTNNDVE